MSGVRPLRHHDLSDLARLHRRCFPSTPFGLDELEPYFADLYLDNPWRAADLPALVHEDGRGRLTGFLGVVPRPMSLDGTPIRAAATSRLMVDPGHRGLAAVRLLQTFLAGPQDLSLADSATPASRVLWERLGGTTATRYSVEWIRPLAPARTALACLAHLSGSSSMEFAARSLGRVADVAMLRLPGSPFRRTASDLTGDPLSDEGVLTCVTASAAGCALRPRWDPRSLTWLLSMLDRKLGGVRKVAVRAGGVVIGSYVYGMARHAMAQVAALVAAPGRLDDVLDHLLDDAARHGAAAVCGRLAPALLGAFGDRLCVVYRAPWVLVHSRSRAVLDCIGRGEASLGRLEGEWWMAF